MLLPNKCVHRYSLMVEKNCLVLRLIVFILGYINPLREAHLYL